MVVYGYSGTNSNIIVTEVLSLPALFKLLIMAAYVLSHRKCNKISLSIVAHSPVSDEEIKICLSKSLHMGMV